MLSLSVGGPCNKHDSSGGLGYERGHRLVETPHNTISTFVHA